MDMEKAPSASIEEVLGEDHLLGSNEDDIPNLRTSPVKEKVKESKIDKRTKKIKSKMPAIRNNAEQISNSSSPIENEKLRRNEHKKKDIGKIELDFEMTDEQKNQEQSLQFGATPISEISSEDLGHMNQKSAGIGHGLNQSKNQNDLLEFKRQGQQGVQGSQSGAHPSSQVDLLDMLDDSGKSSSNNQNCVTNFQATSLFAGGSKAAVNKGKKASVKAQAPLTKQ